MDPPASGPAPDPPAAVVVPDPSSASEVPDPPAAAAVPDPSSTVALPAGPVVIRPRRSRLVAWVAAVAVAASFAVAGIISSSSGTGVYFRGADQVSIAVIGLALAGVILLAVRPRVRADAEGIEIRNVLGARRLPWASVLRVGFPDGAPWARLDLPSDEYLPVLAIQAVDGRHAVDAIRRVRALHAAARAR